MTKTTSKGLLMSAVYETSNLKDIKKVWHDGKKIWSATSKYDNAIHYFETLDEIKYTGIY